MIVKLPKRASGVEELIVSILAFGPVLYLIYLWKVGDKLYFEHSLVNVLAQSSIIGFPLILAYIFFSPKIDQVLSDEESVVGKSSYLSSFRGDWWHTLMLLPAFVAGILFLIQRGILLIMERQTFSTRPGEALITMFIVFGYCIFYGTMFRSSSVTVSGNGLMCGHRFHYWSAIDHAPKRGGNFHVYLKINSKLPFMTIIPQNSKDRSLVEQYLVTNGVDIATTVHPIEVVVKAAVIIVSILLFVIGSATHSKKLLDDRWIVIFLFVAGLLSTMGLEKIRRVSNDNLVPPTFVENASSDNRQTEPSQQGNRADSE